MKTKIYQKYCNSLNVDDIVDGIQKCFSNALFLYKEAKVSVKRRKYSLAYYFLCVSEEEYIKSYLLFYYFSIVNSGSIGKFWRYFRNHEPKERLILLKRHLQAKDTKTYIENIYFLINQQNYENIKQNSLYCDCVTPKQFVKPSLVFVKKDTVREITRLSKTYNNWEKVIRNKDNLIKTVQFLENNSPEIIPPNIAFEKIYGKPLINK